MISQVFSGERDDHFMLTTMKSIPLRYRVVYTEQMMQGHGLKGA